MALSVQVFPDKQALGRAAGEPGRGGHRPRRFGARGGAHPGRDGRLPVRVSRSAHRVSRNRLEPQSKCSISTNTSGCRRSPGELPQVLLQRLIVPTGIRRYHFLDGDGTRPRSAPGRAAIPSRRRSTSRSWASARTATWRSTTRPPTSTPRTLPGGGARRGQPPPAGGRGVVRVAGGRADPGRSPSRSVESWLHQRGIVCVVPDARKAEAVQELPGRSGQPDGARLNPADPFRIRRSIWIANPRRCSPRTWVREADACVGPFALVDCRSPLPLVRAQLPRSSDAVGAGQPQSNQTFGLAPLSSTRQITADVPLQLHAHVRGERPPHGSPWARGAGS